MEGDDRFLSLFGYYADLDLAFLNVKDGIRRSPCRKTFCPFRYVEMVLPPLTVARNVSTLKGCFFWAALATDNLTF
jgi:hypothetical protein